MYLNSNPNLKKKKNYVGIQIFLLFEFVTNTLLEKIPKPGEIGCQEHGGYGTVKRLFYQIS